MTETGDRTADDVSTLADGVQVDPTRRHTAEAVQAPRLHLTVESDHDERAVKVATIAAAVINVLTVLHERSDGNTVDGVSQEYVDDLEAGFRTWQQVRDHGVEEFLQDIESLDRDVLADVRGNLVYLGPHFGVDVDLADVEVSA